VEELREGPPAAPNAEGRNPECLKKVGPEDTGAPSGGATARSGRGTRWLALR